MGGYYSQDDIGRSIENAAANSSAVAIRLRHSTDIMLKIYDLLAAAFPSAAVVAEQKEVEREELLRMKRGY